MAISRLITMYSKAAASAGRIAEVLNTPADMKIYHAADINREGDGSGN